MSARWIFMTSWYIQAYESKFVSVNPGLVSRQICSPGTVLQGQWVAQVVSSLESSLYPT